MIDYKKDVIFIQDYVFNSSIVEYDMQSAGLSILKDSGVLTEDQITDLEQMSKDSRNIQLGNMTRDNEAFRDILKQGFMDARKNFIEGNNLQEQDIVCIKKDAIFTTVKCNNLEFGGITFRPKTRWRSYLRLGNVEFLFQDKLKYQVKGLGDTAVDYHRDGWISTIMTIIDKVSNADRSVKGYMIGLIDKYKSGELPERFYHVFKSDPTATDRWHNYNKIIIPIMQILSNVVS
jgi:hypothetical protein